MSRMCDNCKKEEKLYTVITRLLITYPDFIVKVHLCIQCKTIYEYQENPIIKPILEVNQENV